MQLLDELRKRGWSVAVHNDYRVANEPHTFWLFTHPSGFWAKGEGTTDLSALIVADVQAREREMSARFLDANSQFKARERRMRECIEQMPIADSRELRAILDGSATGPW